MIVKAWRDDAHTIPLVAEDGDDVIIYGPDGEVERRIVGAVALALAEAAAGPQPTAIDRVVAVESQVADLDAIIVAVLT